MQPFIEEARGALSDDKTTYFLKSLLVALAVLVPRGSDEAAQLQTLLGDTLRAPSATPPAPAGAAASRATSGATARPRAQVTATAAVEPLSFLLRVTPPGDGTAGIARLSALLESPPAPPSAPSPKDETPYELSL